MINLVESGGADLPTQAEIFIPGGRSFRDLTRLSAAGIPTVARGVRQLDRRRRVRARHERLHVMVKERAKVFLGGPPLVKMATGEETDDESLGGAEMHATHVRASPTTSPSTSSTRCGSAGRSCAGSTGASAGPAPRAAPAEPPQLRPGGAARHRPAPT